MGQCTHSQLQLSNMGMTKQEKIIWKVKNIIETYTQRFLSCFLKINIGLLYTRYDPKDLVGVSSTRNLDSEKLSYDNIQLFDQKPLFICVWASREIGYSLQEGIDFSVKWSVKVGKKRGYITGNGFSYLRAANKVGTEVGHLPLIYMQHEIGTDSWSEYSSWGDYENALLPIASKFRSSQYRRIENSEQALEALKNGYVLFTGMRWYEEMQRPSKYGFFLVPLGSVLGGHAFSVISPLPNGGGYITLQSFGEYYGDSGKAYLKDLFNKDMQPIFIEEHLPFEVKHQYFLEQYEGKAVKAPGENNPEIYEIIKGSKRHIETIEEFTESFNKFYVVGKAYLDRTPNI